jgi:hypothetical protein
MNIGYNPISLSRFSVLREARKPPSVLRPGDAKLRQLRREAAARPSYRSTNSEVIRLLLEPEAHR